MAHKSLPDDNLTDPISKTSDTTVSPYDVFICYSSKDSAAAQAIITAIEEKKIRCWVAPRDIQPGAEWAEAILGGLANCKVLLLVFSGNANDSKQVIREVERAVNLGLPIVPVRIENLMPRRSLEYFISTSHWLDAYESNLEQYIPYVAETVEILIKRKDSGEYVRVPARPLPLWRRLLQNRTFLLACAVLILLAIPFIYYSTLPETFDQNFPGSWKSELPGKGVEWKIDDDGNFARTTTFTETGTISRENSSYVLTSNIENSRYLPWTESASGSLNSCLFPNRLWAVITSLGVVPGPRDPSEEISFLRDNCIWKPDTKSSGLKARHWNYNHTILGQPWDFELEITDDGGYKLTGKYSDSGKFAALNGEWQISKNDLAILFGTYQKIDRNKMVLTNGVEKELWNNTD